MQRFLTVSKALLAVTTAIVCLAFCYALLHSPVFQKGERYEFYTGTSSEEIVLAQSPLAKYRLTGVRGESVRYQGDRVQELIASFRAEVLFQEEAAGVVNYYCYSPVLGKGVVIDGKRVNLHIATNDTQTAAGTPVIFGGF